MHKLRYFFLFIFFSGMLFTVLNYIPILEEETSGHLIELCKKASQKDGSDPCSDDDTDNNVESDHHACTYSLVNLCSSQKKIAVRSSFYGPPDYSSITPPPKI